LPIGVRLTLHALKVASAHRWRSKKWLNWQTERRDLYRVSSNKNLPPNAHQRVGAISNAHAGREFEKSARDFLSSQGLELDFNFSALIGHERKKAHKFDLGGDSPPVLVECKSYTWTSGGNTPSAKLRSLNEAMLHFILAPPGYRKILIVQESFRESRSESLAEYYLRTQGHMVPEDVEVWELNPGSMSGRRLELEAAAKPSLPIAPPTPHGIANSMPTTDDFREAIRKKLRLAEMRQATFLDINSGELHRELGGYPGPKAAMPSCCNAMYAEQKAADSILAQPPKGKGASLTIRYKIPR